MRKRPPIVLTVVVWLAFVLVLGFWRLFYAWRFGNLLQFLAQDFPRLVVILIAVLLFESFYFRRQQRGP